MEWLRENFFWLVVGALFLWMHLKMHGGHGHGGHGGRGPRDSDGETSNAREREEEGRHAEH